MKHKANMNLDDESEIASFISTHRTLKGRSLANRLGFTGKLAVKSANALSNYAWNKHTAISLRKSGNISEAQRYENICDLIYTRDIQPNVICW